MGTVKTYTVPQLIAISLGYQIGTDGANLIEEAVTLTQEIIRGDIEKSLWSCVVHGDPDYGNDCAECKDALEVDVIVNNVLRIESLC